MSRKVEEIYSKFTDESIGLKIPKQLLLSLLGQINRHLEILRCEEEIINNFAVCENVNNAEMIMTKLLLLIADPYEMEEVILFLSIAEFLVLRDLVFCNYSLSYLETKMESNILELYKKLHYEIESIFGMLGQDEVKGFWDYIINYNTKDSTLN